MEKWAGARVSGHHAPSPSFMSSYCILAQGPGLTLPPLPSTSWQEDRMNDAATIRNPVALSGLMEPTRLVGIITHEKCQTDFIILLVAVGVA